MTSYVTKYLDFGENGAGSARTGCGTCTDDGNSCNTNGGEYPWSGSCGQGCSLAWDSRSNCIHWSNYGIDPKITYCPQIGTVSSASYDQNQRKFTCTYSSINSTVALDSLSTYFSSGTVNTISANRCSGLTATALYNSGECKNYYKNSSGNYNFEILDRIENMNGAWVTDITLVNFIHSILTQDATVRASSLNWAADVSKAKGIVAAYCTANPMSDKCACYHVVKNGANCSDMAKSVLPGCKEVASNSSKLAAAAVTIDSISSTNYFCQSSACVDAASNADIFLPDAVQNCNINIAACIQNFINNNMEGATLTNECKNVLTVNTGTGGTGGTSPGGTQNETPAPENETDWFSKWRWWILGGGGGFIILCFCCLIIILSVGSD